jgi:hypothetical protein
MTSVEVPDELVRAVREGECVAFLGAGFSAPVVPGWKELLEGIAGKLKAEPRREVLELLAGASHALDFEAAAEILRSGLGRVGFDRAVADALRKTRAGQHTMESRLRAIAEIPFAAVLTTNADAYLRGVPPAPETYGRLLRPDRRWWSEASWMPGASAQFVVKLHGDVEDPERNPLVFSRSDYRERVYGTRGYGQFLRALVATRTILFVGVSFTDAYLNEIRSEVLSVIGRDHRVGYAISNDVPAQKQAFFRDHEGIEILPYETRPAPGGGREGWEGADAWLDALREKTSTRAMLGSVLAGKRVIWLDPEPENNAEGRKLMLEVAQQRGLDLQSPRTVAEALAAAKAKPSDLVLTRFGGQPGSSLFESFVQGFRALPADLQAPVLVFAGVGDAARRRQLVYKLGGLGYVCSWPELFREIYRTLADEPW